jgi:hypothetical protein
MQGRIAAGGGITSGIQTAYLSYQGYKGVTPGGFAWNVAIEGGYSEPPYTLIRHHVHERASAGIIAANIAVGDFRSNFGVFGSPKCTTARANPPSCSVAPSGGTKPATPAVVGPLTEPVAEWFAPEVGPVT